jgi:hypothetical protein
MSKPQKQQFLMNEEESESTSEEDENDFTGGYNTYSSNHAQQRHILKHSLTTPEHDTRKLASIVISSGDRNIFTEHLFHFTIHCTPADENDETPQHSSLLFKLRDVSAMHCVSIIAPPYCDCSTTFYNGNYIPHHMSPHITAALSVLPSNYATNKIYRQSFNSFVPDLIPNSNYLRYLPVLGETRFNSPISYLHGMDWKLHIHPDLHHEQSDPFEPSTSPDVIRIENVTYVAGNTTLTFTPSRPIHPLMMSVGARISAHGKLFEESGASTPILILYLNNIFLKKERQHTVVELQTNGDNFVITFTIVVTLVQAALDPTLLNYAGLLSLNDPVTTQYCILNESLQYNVFFAVEQINHQLAITIDE